MTTHGSRPDGMFCSSSRLTVVDVPVFFGSMTGVSAVTCTCVVHAAERQPDSQRHRRTGRDGNFLLT